MRKWLTLVTRYQTAWKCATMIVVLAAVARYMWKLRDDWGAQQQSSAAPIHLAWLALAVVTYALGCWLFAWLWWRLLHAAHIDVSLPQLARAYFVGALGKYVPGKAFVVIMRTAILPGDAQTRLIVGLSCFYETIGMMAVGAGISGVCLFIEDAPMVYAAGALIAAAGMCLMLKPAMFGHVAHLATKSWLTADTRSVAHSWPRALLRNLWMPFLGWCLLGASAATTARGVSGYVFDPTDVAIWLGAASFSTVAGFIVILMPSGIGVREAALVLLLSPRLGPTAAIAISVMLRIAWTIGDVLLAGAAYWMTRPRSSDSVSFDSACTPCAPPPMRPNIPPPSDA